MFNPDLHLLGLELEAKGFAGRDLAVGAVTRAARHAGLSPVLIDIVASDAEPEPARLRAFARLVAALRRQPDETPATGTATTTGVRAA